jgi:hypothetical protein
MTVTSTPGDNSAMVIPFLSYRYLSDKAKRVVYLRPLAKALS